jgi:hypothetical protein
VQPGDLVVLGTDGLWDNCFDEEVASVLRYCTEQRMEPPKMAQARGRQRGSAAAGRAAQQRAGQRSSGVGSQPRGRPPAPPPPAALQVLAHYARHRAADSKFASPFAYAAFQVGGGDAGGAGPGEPRAAGACPGSLALASCSSCAAARADPLSCAPQAGFAYMGGKMDDITGGAGRGFWRARCVRRGR